jgi:hypothetical protein
LQTFPPDSPAYFAEVSGVDSANAAQFSITSLNMANTTLGLGGYVPDGSSLAPAGRSTSISPPGVDQPVYPADTLTVQASGTIHDAVNLCMVLYYGNLPIGVSGFLGAAGLRERIRNVLVADVACDGSSGTGGQGDWSAPVSLTASARPLNSTRMYALLGWTSDLPCAAVGVSGFETANRRVGGPGLADGSVDANFFLRLAAEYNANLIPVFNGANQDSINVQVADPSTTNVNIGLQFAELR